MATGRSVKHGLPAPAGPLLESEIVSVDLEGRGIAHHEGKVAFIEGAAPGERVRWQARRSRASYDVGQVVEVLRASSQRVVPRCRHFGLAQGSCGGCSMQHIDARAQLAIKQRALEDALWHIGRLRPDTILPPIAGPQWGYRQRARLSVRYVQRKGGVLVGFHERASSYVADMQECHVLPPRVAALLLPLRELIGSLTIRERLPQVELAVGADADGAPVVLVFRVLLPPTATDRQALATFGRDHAAAIWLQPGGPATAAPLGPIDAVPLVIALAEADVRIPFGPTDFTQVNHRVNEVLVRRALALLAVQPGDRVVDLFCGLGNFTLPIARTAASVLGVEGSSELARRAAAAAQGNGVAERTTFEVRDLFKLTAQDWRAIRERAGGIDRVLVDPPREGALEVARVLAAEPFGVRRLVYVSCNPATLARDCAVLVHEGGWRLREAGVVNMFPQTSHVESIAWLTPPTESPSAAPPGAGSVPLAAEDPQQ